jgi:hypothetical protein
MSTRLSDWLKDKKVDKSSMFTAFYSATLYIPAGSTVTNQLASSQTRAAKSH